MSLSLERKSSHYLFIWIPCGRVLIFHLFGFLADSLRLNSRCSSPNKSSVSKQNSMEIFAACLNLDWWELTAEIVHDMRKKNRL